MRKTKRKMNNFRKHYLHLLCFSLQFFFPIVKLDMFLFSQLGDGQLEPLLSVLRGWTSEQTSALCSDGFRWHSNPSASGAMPEAEAPHRKALQPGAMPEMGQWTVVRGR